MRLFRLLMSVFFLGVCANGLLLARQLAFPGAEGAGRFTKGGRGGDIYFVTNLNDNGLGSLREAVEAEGPRTVVFQVSGTIALKSDLKVKNSYLTIAGQTAPGDGICLKDYPFFIGDDEVIVRYMRFRLGDESGVEKDAIWGRECKNVIVDHCSASWSVDESMSLYGIDSLTVQWCLISESLYMSYHSKGAHGYGGIWGGNYASFHHNLIAHHSSRTPRFAGGETTTCVNVDFRNNVIYNWGFNGAYGGEEGSINMVANYFKSGPATKESKKYRIVQPYGTEGRWYIKDNYVDGSTAVTEDNWDGGVLVGAYAKSVIRVDTPFPYEFVTMQSAENAYQEVLENAGANFPSRDEVDMRVLNDVINGNATYDGTYYAIEQDIADTSVVRGIIDSQDEVGGWPELLSDEVPLDADFDGMPDDWENENGLNVNDDSDRNCIADNGYTMLENYINSLVPAEETGIEQLPAVSKESRLLKNYPNPFNPITTIIFELTKAEHVTLSVYNALGQQVLVLAEKNFESGQHQLVFDAVHISAGLYFYKLETKNFMQVKKMLLFK